MVYVRKFIHSREELLKEGKSIVVSDPDAKFVFRVVLTNLALSGMKPSEIETYSGVNKRTIEGWVSKVDRHGFESLRAVKQTGRPPKLTKEQKEEIKCILNNGPEKSGYPYWDGVNLSNLILVRYGIEYSVRASQKLFHELGYSLIRPQTYPSLGNQDEEARNEFKKTIAEKYNDPSRVVAFQDEVHFSIQATIIRMWAPTGSEPKVKSYPGRNNIAYSGFIIPETGVLWVDKPGWFRYDSTIGSIRGFLKANPLTDGRKYTIVMDNAPWHKKALRLIKENVDGEYSDMLEMAEFIRLPPYSPDLNPIEQVWRYTRRKRTHNRFFSDLKSLEKKLDEFFRVLRHPNKHLRTLCTFSWMKQSVSASS